MVTPNSAPELVVMPGYPVYYAPNVAANYFFYDGLYWVFNVSVIRWNDGCRERRARRASARHRGERPRPSVFRSRARSVRRRRNVSADGNLRRSKSSLSPMPREKQSPREQAFRGERPPARPVAQQPPLQDHPGQRPKEERGHQARGPEGRPDEGQGQGRK